MNLGESWGGEIADEVGVVEISVVFWLLDGLISSDFGFGVMTRFNLANSERNFSVIWSMVVLKWSESFLNWS